MAKILVIDDDKMVRVAATKLLRRAGHEVWTAENGRVGVKSLENQPVDLVITDLIMPEMEGIETTKTIRGCYPNLPIIAMSGGGRTKNTDYLNIIEKLGADATLAKPFSMKQLLDTVSTLLTGGQDHQRSN